MENLDLIILVIVLVAAFIGGVIARRLGLPVILGYLIGGIAVGPYGFGLVQDVDQISTVAEIGVVLLLFTLGLEFSLKTMRRTGRVAIIGGIVQILTTIALGLVIGINFIFFIKHSINFASINIIFR